ncbi:helix-turn-helix family protein [Staphylococcus gallinarum]|nr:helix-turn-helix family protein [Staphylococcus gallinarum]
MNMTQEQLGKKLETKKSTISNYETGYRTPQQDDLFEIAHVLNVSIDDLFPKRQKSSNTITTVYNQLTPPRQENVLNYANNQLEEQNKVTSIDEYKEDKLIPFTAYGATGAGIGEELYEDTLKEEVYFKEDDIPENADFCILVNGDSMEPMLKKGTYTFIKHTETIKDRTIALIVLDGTVLIKRVDIYPEYLKLISLNPKYEDITVASFNDIRVIGKVVL